MAIVISEATHLGNLNTLKKIKRDIKFENIASEERRREKIA
jgi:hypothetical protein